MFADADIKYTETELTNSTLPSSANLTKVGDAGKFITCAIMEMKPITLQDTNKQNSLYFKSEVVVKGQDYGFILWTYLSTMDAKVSQEQNKYGANLDFFYRLITLKRTGNKWEVEGGLGWDHFSLLQYAHEKFVVLPPMEREGWFASDKPRHHSDQTPFQERAWAGIGEVDEKEGKDLLQSISIYNIDNSTDNREVWGGNGEFAYASDKGYTSVKLFYTKGKGWEKFNGTTRKDMSSELKDWYKPFKDKKIKWSNLGDRCDAWSKIRGQAISSEEEHLKALCYSKSNG